MKTASSGWEGKKIAGNGNAEGEHTVNKRFMLWLTSECEYVGVSFQNCFCVANNIWSLCQPPCRCKEPFTTELYISTTNTLALKTTSYNATTMMVLLHLMAGCHSMLSVSLILLFSLVCFLIGSFVGLTTGRQLNHKYIYCNSESFVFYNDKLYAKLFLQSKAQVYNCLSCVLFYCTVRKNCNWIEPTPVKVDET